MHSGAQKVSSLTLPHKGVRFGFCGAFWRSRARFKLGTLCLLYSCLAKGTEHHCKEKQTLRHLSSPDHPVALTTRFPFNDFHAVRFERLLLQCRKFCRLLDFYTIRASSSAHALLCLLDVVAKLPFITLAERLICYSRFPRTPP